MVGSSKRVELILAISFLAFLTIAISFGIFQVKSISTNDDTQLSPTQNQINYKTQQVQYISSTGNDIPHDANAVFNELRNDNDFKGYIVLLPTSPKLKLANPTVLKNSKTQTLTQSTTDWKNAITAEHNNFKKQFSSLKITREYTTTINGFAVSGDISDQMLAEIINLGGKVYPDYKIDMLLYESVPLIHADKVWTLNSNAEPCITPPLNTTNNTLQKNLQSCLQGNGVSVGIIDTGVDYTHPDFGACTQQQFLSGECKKVVGGYDFADNDNDPMDEYGHGTHVAATVAGNGKLKGVAPQASLYAFKVFSGGSGSESAVLSAIERSYDLNNNGYIYGIDNEEKSPNDILDVISLSLGGRGGPDSPLSLAIDTGVDYGVTAVVAAGNSGPTGNFFCRDLSYPDGGYNSICSPGSARNAITVGASFKKNYEGTFWEETNPVKGQITKFSSRGTTYYGISKPDISAPGTFICAAEASQDKIWQAYKDKNGIDIHCIDDKHISISGTSMATPHVTGVVALIKQQHPMWTPLKIKSLLEYTSHYYPNLLIEQGSGMVDALDAVVKSAHLDDVPAIQAELSTSKYYSGPFNLKYSVEYNNRGTIKVDRTVLKDDDFDPYDQTHPHLPWDAIIEEPYDGSQGTKKITRTLSLDFLDKNNYGEAYRISFIMQDKPSMVFTKYVILRNSFTNGNYYLKGWPQTIETGSRGILNSVNIGTFLDSVKKNIVTDIDPYSPSYKQTKESAVYDYQGTKITDLIDNHRSFSGINIDKILFFDMDGDGKNELFHDGFLFNNGLPLTTQWTYNYPQKDNREYYKWALAKITSSSSSKIVVGKENLHGGEQGVYIYDVSGQSTMIDSSNLGSANLAIGDFYGDGAKDIAYVTSGGDLKISNFADEQHFIVNKITHETLHNLVLSDLDNDKKLDLLGTNDNGYIYWYTSDGKYRPPVSCGHSGASICLDIKVGNIDDDANLEVSVLSFNKDENKYYINIFKVVNNRLEKINSIDVTDKYSALMSESLYLYDTNNDGKVEIFFIGKERLYLYDAQGNLLSDEVPLNFEQIGWDFLNQPVFDDIDNDGNLNLVMHTLGGPISGDGKARIYVWNLPFKYYPNKINWLRNGYDAGETSCYLCD